jgi:tripartite-type tricarboxylate transporter receptor subunit TctC
MCARGVGLLRTSAFGGIVALLLYAAAGSAQTGTIRFIVGTAPGGAIDPYARLIADHMTKTLRQTIIVEHRPGANGNMSAQFVAEAPADGALVWIGTQAFTEINPSVFKNQRWSIDNFRPLIRGVEAPLVLVTHPSVPASTFAEFIAWAQANRGKLSYSSYNPGTPSHFLGYQLNEKFGLDLTHVPYRGSGVQVTGLIGGHCCSASHKSTRPWNKCAPASSRRSA